MRTICHRAVLKRVWKLWSRPALPSNTERCFGRDKIGQVIFPLLAMTPPRSDHLSNVYFLIAWASKNMLMFGIHATIVFWGQQKNLIIHGSDRGDYRCRDLGALFHSKSLIQAFQGPSQQNMRLPCFTFHESIWFFLLAINTGFLLCYLSIFGSIIANMYDGFVTNDFFPSNGRILMTLGSWKLLWRWRLNDSVNETNRLFEDCFDDAWRFHLTN